MTKKPKAKPKAKTTKLSAKVQRDKIKKAIKPLPLGGVQQGPFAAFKSVSDRVEYVRDAVAKASDGVDGADYTQLFEELISDAEGWSDDLKNREAEAESESEDEGATVVSDPPKATVVIDGELEGINSHARDEEE